MVYKKDRGKNILSSCLLLYGALQLIDYGSQLSWASLSQDKLDQNYSAPFIGFVVRAEDASPRRKLAGEAIVEITGETYANSKSSI